MTGGTKLIAFLVISLFLLVIVRPAAAGQFIYVDADANGINDGSSWSNAYRYLQDALADANYATKPVEIRVAQGIYTPDSNSADPNGSGDRTATFQLINGVILKGGYAGFGELDPNVQDIEIHETILSGDLAGNDDEVNDPCDLLSEPTRAENSYHVVTGSSTDNTAVLDGFTITAGNADGSFPDYDGAGMYSYDGSPTILNCTLSENAAKRNGGGMYNTMLSSPTLTNCTFSSNVACWGGGMQNNGGSSLILTDCTFSRNCATAGGGMKNSGSNVTLTNCTFSRNSSNEYSGGAMYDYTSRTSIIKCAFKGNSAGERGGAIRLQDTSATIINCIISGNSAGGDGGGIYWPLPPLPGTSKFPNGLKVALTITNCTISGNTADRGGGIYNGAGGRIPTNCILWGNSDSGGMDESAQLHGFAMPNYCCIQGWTGALGGIGNIADDPLFADESNGDYNLKSQAGRWDPNSQTWLQDDVTSPCINAGNPNSPIGLEPFPNGGIINMGAYGGTSEASKSYFDQPVCTTVVAGDINGDCKVNFLDFRLMALHWLRDENK